MSDSPFETFVTELVAKVDMFQAPRLCELFIARSSSPDDYIAQIVFDDQNAAMAWVVRNLLSSNDSRQMIQLRHVGELVGTAWKADNYQLRVSSDPCVMDEIVERFDLTFQTVPSSLVG